MYLKNTNGIITFHENLHDTNTLLKELFNVYVGMVSGKNEGHDWKTVIANHVLIDMPNVVITPHNAFNTKEAIERILDTTVENLSGYLKGEIVNQVK